MLEPVILGLLGTMVVIAVPIGLRWEHRLTRVETKMDRLLENNGINPKDCVPPPKEKKKRKTEEQQKKK